MATTIKSNGVDVGGDQNNDGDYGGDNENNDKKCEKDKSIHRQLCV